MLLKRTQRYTVEKCAAGDIAAVMAFFGEEHDPEHILAVGRRFVDWQYYDPGTERYNIIIAKDNNNAVLGLLTYTTNTFFDGGISPERKFIWMNNWLAKKDYKGFIGLELLWALPECENCARMGTVGPSAAAAAFYKKTGYRVGRLGHYFFANENVKEFRILRGSIPRPTRKPSPGARLLRLDSLAALAIHSDAPFKSPMFYENKYMKNPFYDYFAYGLETGGRINAALIGRRLRHNGANAIRLVEYIGHEQYLSGLRPQEILDGHDAEYLDFYCAGISERFLSDAGFSLNTGEDGLIVPNYFEPYKNANIEIAYAYNAPECPVFKGDGDREHPRADTLKTEVV